MTNGCTCAMGQPPRGIDACHCTTTISDCIVHGTSEIAQKKRELAKPALAIVIAHDYQDYVSWCQANPDIYRDCRLVFAQDENSVSGLTGPAEVFTTARGYFRPDIMRIRQAIRVIQQSA